MQKRQILKAFLLTVSLVIKIQRCLQRNWSAEKTPSIIPDSEIGYFCPDVDVCGSKHPTSRLSQKHVMAGYKRCCEECSCESNCTKEQNCCYPRWENYAQIDRSDQDCFFPGTISMPNSIQYFMTFKTENKGMHNTNDSLCLSIDTQGNFDLRDLYPVYSPTSNRIFVNERCALLHNVTDGIPWDAYSICSSFSALESSDKHLTELTENGKDFFLSTTCGLFFGVPNEFKETETEHCFSDLVNSCNGDNFEIPSGSNMSKQDVIDACQNGFFSPYIRRKHYANVFCYICNGHVFSQDNICVKRKIFKEKKGASDFFVMLDFNLLRSNNDEKNTAEVCIKSAGKMGSGKSCRRLHCPPGYIRQTDGKCKCVILKWLVHRLDIKVELIPAKRILLIDILEFNKSWLKSPWPKSWKVMRLMYTKSTRDNETVEYLVVHLVNVNPNTNFSLSIENMKRHLSHVWLLRNDKGFKTVLRQEIYKYKLFEMLSSDNGKYVPYWTTVETLNMSFPVLRGVYSQQQYEVKGVPLVNLIKNHFCEQIELEENDYTMYGWDLVLFNKLESRYFHDGEFTLVTNKLGLTRPRICVDETAFGRVSKGTLNVLNNLSWKNIAFHFIFEYFVVNIFYQ